MAYRNAFAGLSKMLAYLLTWPGSAITFAVILIVGIAAGEGKVPWGKR